MAELKINWNEVREEAAHLLSDYIKFNTTNPPGNEREAADFLAGLLKKNGLAPEVFVADGKRANLLCSLKGSGSKKPLVLLNHIDVVGAEDKDWSVPPFGGVIKDSYVWGRGAIDCKGLGIMELMAMVVMKRNNIIPGRDIIFVAVADEEAGGDFGARWVVNNLWEKIDAEYVLNEGGVGISGMFGMNLMLPCFGEKGPLWLKFKARGEAGHGSIPIAENANNKLIKALEKIVNYETPIILLPEIKKFLRNIIASRGTLLSLIAPVVINSFVLNLFRSKLKSAKKINAVLRNTISITNLKAGYKENVIPSQSEAILDCRLLPGQSVEKFIEELKRIINDEDIEIEVVQQHSPSHSSPETPMLKKLKEIVLKNNPGILFNPYIAPGFTDSRFFREKGTIAYGLMPCLFTQEEIDTIHGVNERISLKCLEDGIKNIFELCCEI